MEGIFYMIFVYFIFMIILQFSNDKMREDERKRKIIDRGEEVIE